MSASRREFLLGLAATGVLTKASALASMNCPFRLSVINDELTEDFDRACQIASQDFGLQLD